LEAREYASIEQKISEAEERLRVAKERYEDPAIASDATKLIETQAELEKAQTEVDALILRWTELEEKTN